MSLIGRVESVWRYPVKSMRGQRVDEAYVGFAGVYGDRVYAIHDLAAPAGFPYLTARERGDLLQYTPRFRAGEAMARPVNLEAAEALSPGLTPVYADGEARDVEVETPAGEMLGIDDPRLLALLSEGLRERQVLHVLRSDRAMTDCRPISLFATATARALGDELGRDVDQRRFRANVYVELDSGKGFGEDEYVGRTLRVGEKATVTVLDRDPRCKMVTLDPETSEADPEVMKRIAHGHDGKAGVYAAVLVEGVIRAGDPIELMN